MAMSLSSPDSTSLHQLFDENLVAKIVRTASTTPSDGFPETVPQDGPQAGRWAYREPDFWTCGFFPGSLYALLERYTKHPQASPGGTARIRAHLQQLSAAWTTPLHRMAGRTDTHDLGFIVMPALRRQWELTADPASLQAIVEAAHSLASRYVPAAGAIRSWDCLLKTDRTVTDCSSNLLVIIDSLCNLDLLFYAAAHAGNAALARVAVTHARTVLRTHLREVQCVSGTFQKSVSDGGHMGTPNGVQSETVQSKSVSDGTHTKSTSNGIHTGSPSEIHTTHSNDLPSGDTYCGPLYSTSHVANLCPHTGDLQYRCTAQGYADESTWARGQAWAILGYAQTYLWTHEEIFLDAACGLAEYFLRRLETQPGGTLVPPWDFDAPGDDYNQQNETNGEKKVEDARPARDSSAGVIAANGLLVLSQALMGKQDGLARRFRQMSLGIVRDTLRSCRAEEEARFIERDAGADADGQQERLVEDCVAGCRFDAVLKHGTANNHRFARRRYADHGLVYGDYYLVEFGNRLLDLGIV